MLCGTFTLNIQTRDILGCPDYTLARVLGLCGKCGDPEGKRSCQAVSGKSRKHTPHCLIIICREP